MKKTITLRARKATLTILSFTSILFFYSCTNNKDKNMTENTIYSSAKIKPDITENNALKPSNPKPEWGKDLTDPMATVIEKLVSYNAPPLINLSAKEARKQPTPADATMDVMKERNISAPASNVDITNREIPVKGGNITIRVYTPKTNKESYPVIVYYHGGGWVIADLDTYNASAEGLSNQVEAIVVSVAYRQAPEFKFPTAHNDCYAAYEWTVKNASSIKGNPKKIAVVGESAGGNLAASVSMIARDKGFQLPVHEVLVYPIAGYDFNTESYKESEKIKPLDSQLMKWFFDHYLNSPTDGSSPMISLVTANLKGLPSTTIIGAQYDPLRSEGKMLSDNLTKAGVKTTYKLYKGTTHEFFGMAAVVSEAKEAQSMVSSELKSAFNN